MPGRAASRMRSDLFRPEMAISTSGRRPVERPGDRRVVGGQLGQALVDVQDDAGDVLQPLGGAACRMA